MEEQLMKLKKELKEKVDRIEEMKDAFQEAVDEQILEFKNSIGYRDPKPNDDHNPLNSNSNSDLNMNLNTNSKSPIISLQSIEIQTDNEMEEEFKRVRKEYEGNYLRNEQNERNEGNEWNKRHDNIEKYEKYEKYEHDEQYEKNQKITTCELEIQTENANSEESLSVIMTLLKTIAKERETELNSKVTILTFLEELKESLKKVLSSKSKKEFAQQVVSTIPHGIFKIVDENIVPKENIILLINILLCDIRNKLTKKEIVQSNIMKYREIIDKANHFIESHSI